jgi:chromosome segregation ATPase
MNAPDTFIQANYPQGDPMLEPIGGTTAQSVNQQAAQIAPKNKLDYYMRGGLGNTARQSIQNVEKRRALRDIQKKFQDLVSKGESSADQFLSEVKQRYPNADEYIPPKDIFVDPATGQFKAYDWFKSAYVGYEELKKKEKEEKEKQRKKDLIGSVQQHAQGVQEGAAQTGSQVFREDYRGSALQQPFAQEEGAFDVVGEYEKAYQSKKDDEALLLRKEANRIRELGLSMAKNKEDADLVDKRLKQIVAQHEMVGDNISQAEKQSEGHRKDRDRVQQEVDTLEKKLGQAWYNEEQKAQFAKQLEEKRRRVGQIQSLVEKQDQKLLDLNESMVDIKNAYREFIASNGGTGTVTSTIKQVTETPPEPIAPPSPAPAAQPAQPSAPVAPPAPAQPSTQISPQIIQRAQQAMQDPSASPAAKAAAQKILKSAGRL